MRNDILKGVLDAVIVGAGFAGMQMLYRLRGDGLKVKVLESGSDVGGTWYWNRYPGARCDVESMQYSYQFCDDLQQDWEWTERYATQPEILSYANHVADRFDLRRDIQFNCCVAAVTYDETNKLWTINSEHGDVVRARFCIMATGCLSSTTTPDFDGLATFRGQCYHTGQWPAKEIDFSGKRVAVIGTGSSGIQAIPEIAKQAEHLTVFQRTPSYSLPARNAPLSTEAVEEIKTNYADFRMENKGEYGGVSYPRGLNETSALEVSESDRNQEFETRWQIGGVGFISSFGDLLFLPQANQLAAAFIRDKIRGIVNNPQTAEALCPEIVVGCKRICLDTDYYITFNRDNVSLVSVKDHPIEAISERGVMTNGREYEVDAIVFATGFDAMTGALLKINIQGRGGKTLQEKWRDGPVNYLGLGVNGFPNLFMVCGPGSPSVLTNVLVSIDQHVNWIADCIQSLDEQSLQCIEAQATAEKQWFEHVNEVASFTLFTACNSWYAGANVPGKPQGFMPYAGGVPGYAAKCEEVASKGYEGFDLM